MDEFAIPAKKPRLTGAQIRGKRIELSRDSTSQRSNIPVPGSYSSIAPTSILLVLPTSTLPTSIRHRYPSSSMWMVILYIQIYTTMPRFTSVIIEL